MRFSQMNRKRLIMIVIELWIIMDKEDLVDLDEDSSEDLMREILVIFSLHSLVVEWVDEAGDPEQELI